MNMAVHVQVSAQSFLYIRQLINVDDPKGSRKGCILRLGGFSMGDMLEFGSVD